MLNGYISQERTNFNDIFLTDNLPHLQKFYQNKFFNPYTKMPIAGIMNKVDVPNTIADVSIWDILFEWYVVRCSSKNGHQKYEFKRD